MNVIIERLSQPGGPRFIRVNFVKGFPGSDIDIPVALADCHLLAELQSDYNELTRKIGQNIQILHSARRLSSSAFEINSGRSAGPVSHSSTVISSQVTSTAHNHLQNVATSMDIDVLAKLPFAVVDEITEGSPSAVDGLQLGDLILKFRNVESGTDLLSRLASEVPVNQGRKVLVVLLREGAALSLAVTRRTWQGEMPFSNPLSQGHSSALILKKISYCD